MSYTPRVSEKILKRYLSAFPIVGVTGPRQSGKSTLLKHVLTDYHYVTFDHPSNIEEFNTDPEKFLKIYQGNVIFDEVQHVPDLLHYLKIKVDENRNVNGQFVITGSNQLMMLEKITESLAGRIGLMTLLPYQYRELPNSKVLKEEVIYKGSYPQLLETNYFESDLWYESYMDTYINKDVRMISNIGNLHDFQKLIHLLAIQVGATLDYSEYAREIGVSVPTIKHWISVLQTSYIIYLLPAYHKNLSKRLIKSPKIYFYDTGLVSWLTGVKTFELYEKGPMAGRIFENYIVSEIIKKINHEKIDATPYFLRTSDKTEIDLVLDKKTSIDWIEIKKSASFNPKMTKPIETFISEKDQGYLLYNGENRRYLENIKVIHYSDYLLL